MALIKEVVSPASQAGKPRGISEVSFTYFDLDASIDLSRQVLHKGGGACAPDQLAAWLGYETVNSGTFKTRVSAARQFGLVENNNGQIAITERAKTIMAPVLEDDATNAKADAFLNVALYRAVYERFRGGSIPQEAGMFNLFEHTFKIIPGRVSQAYRVMMASAEQAGFLREGKTKMIRPGASSAAIAKPVAKDAKPVEADKPPETTSQQMERRMGGGGGDGGGGIHTALVGLLRHLPKPGESWTTKQQEDFLTAFTATVKFVFPAQSGGNLDA